MKGFWIGLAALVLMPHGAWALEKNEQQAIDILNAYFSHTRHLQGTFVQTNPSGDRATGVFYLRRPNRAHFAYDPPSQVRIVVDGTWLTVQETQNSEVDRLPLRTTPLRFLLGRRVDLARNPNVEIISARKTREDVQVTMARKDEKESGALTINLGLNPTRILGWSVLDPQGLTTRVLLSNLREGVVASHDLFVVRDSTQSPGGAGERQGP